MKPYLVHVELGVLVYADTSEEAEQAVSNEYDNASEFTYFSTNAQELAPEETVYAEEPS